MTFKNLTIERHAGVALLWLDRPEKLKALHRALWHSIPAAVAHLDEDADVRAIVVAGRGKAFCAGVDLLDHAPGLTGGGSISGCGESAVARRRGLLSLIIPVTLIVLILKFFLIKTLSSVLAIFLTLFSVFGGVSKILSGLTK